MPPDTSAAGLPAEGGGGFWLSISDLAKHKGLSKQALAERVARFEAAGKISTRPGPGRAKLVNVAEFDRAAGEIGDLGREQGAATRRGAPLPAPAAPAATTIPPRPFDPEAPVYTVEQARNMAYKAELARLELEERQGKIVSVDIVRAGALRAGEEIVRVLDRLPQVADELAVALTKEGAHGVRLALKRVALAMRTDIDAALAAATAESLRATPQEGASGAEATHEGDDS